MTSRPFAVVTGASSGIGRELAREFASNGFDLLVAAEDDAIATKLQGKGSRFLPDAAKAALHRKLAEPGSAR